MPDFLATDNSRDKLSQGFLSPVPGGSHFRAVPVSPGMSECGEIAVNKRVATAVANSCRSQKSGADAQARQHDTAERQAAEAEAQRLAKLRGGVPADRVPEGVHPATAMLQAAKGAAPRRRTPLKEPLATTGSLTYHRIRDES